MAKHYMCIGKCFTPVSHRASCKRVLYKFADLNTYTRTYDATCGNLWIFQYSFQLLSFGYRRFHWIQFQYMRYWRVLNIDCASTSIEKVILTIYLDGDFHIWLILELWIFQRLQLFVGRDKNENKKEKVKKLIIHVH